MMVNHRTAMNTFDDMCMYNVIDADDDIKYQYNNADEENVMKCHEELQQTVQQFHAANEGAYNGGHYILPPTYVQL
jgi:hypothetical protein